MDALTKHSILRQANVTYSASTESPLRRYIDASFDALGEDDSLYLKVHSASASTMWLSITNEQAQKIREILKEPKP